MRHNAVMGVVAVACAAVVSAPLLVGHNGGHHRGEKYAKRHQNLAGVFAGDGEAADGAPPIVALVLADLKPGDLAAPTGPVDEDESDGFSPFIGILPPLLGAGYAGGLQQAPSPPKTPDLPHLPQPMNLAFNGVGGGGGASAPVVPPVTPDPPLTQDPPPVIPDPPVPPEPPPVVVIEVATPPPPPPPPPPPQPDPPVALRITQSVVVAPAAIPEPATWAMMILGLGAIGAAARRRQRDAGQRGKREFGLTRSASRPS